MIPRTIGGKLIASMTSVSGVIVLAFPVTMIVTNFNILYQQCNKLKGDDKKANMDPSDIKAHSVVIL